jgi:hypothetical protein
LGVNGRFSLCWEINYVNLLFAKTHFFRELGHAHCAFPETKMAQSTQTVPGLWPWFGSHLLY